MSRLGLTKYTDFGLGGWGFQSFCHSYLFPFDRLQSELILIGQHSIYPAYLEKLDLPDGFVEINLSSAFSRNISSLASAYFLSRIWGWAWMRSKTLHKLVFDLIFFGSALWTWFLLGSLVHELFITSEFGDELDEWRVHILLGVIFFVEIERLLKFYFMLKLQE